MIVLALALPLLMMAALFALDAFESWLFPPPSPPKAQALGAPRQTAHPDNDCRAAHPRELCVTTSRQDGRRRSPRAGR